MILFKIFRLSLPQPIPGKHQPNDLDRHIRQMREKCLQKIVERCEKIANVEFENVLDELENLNKMLDNLEIEVTFYGFKFLF